MTGTFYVDPNARTQIFTVGSLPTLPRDVHYCAERARMPRGRFMAFSPALLYFVVITLLWGVLVRGVVGPARVTAQHIREMSQAHLDCETPTATADPCVLPAESPTAELDAVP
jgi:hypothetical protein